MEKFNYNFQKEHFYHNIVWEILNYIFLIRLNPNGEFVEYYRTQLKISLWHHNDLAIKLKQHAPGCQAKLF